MRWRLIDSTPPAYVVVLDPNDEAFGTLSSFARDDELTAAHVTGIGALERTTVGWFDQNGHDYRHIEVRQQREALSLTGDITEGPDKKLALHL